MMRKILSVILFSCSCCFTVQGQDIRQVKAHADEQFARGHLTGALKEYQRVLFFDAEHRFDDVYGDIANVYFEQGEFRQAMTYYDLARKAVDTDSLKLEYSFRKILCHFMQERYLLGLADLYDLPETETPYFHAKKNLYLAICHFGLDETDRSLDYFEEVVDSSGMEQIRALIQAFGKHQKKYDPDKLEMISIFLPGVGQIIAGDLKNGLNSILLLGGIVAYSYYTMVTYGWLDGALVLLGWSFRYYTGGHKKAYELGAERIREQRSVTYRQLLEVVGRHSLR